VLEDRPHPRLLRAIVFTVGVSTLGSEIAAARLMAPFFGASTIVWANTIATVHLRIGRVRLSRSVMTPQITMPAPMTRMISAATPAARSGAMPWVRLRKLGSQANSEPAMNSCRPPPT